MRPFLPELLQFHRLPREGIEDDAGSEITRLMRSHHYALLPGARDLIGRKLLTSDASPQHPSAKRADLKEAQRQRIYPGKIGPLSNSPLSHFRLLKAGVSVNTSSSARTIVDTRSDAGPLP
jgi:hypothetical protein